MLSLLLAISILFGRIYSGIEDFPCPQLILLACFFSQSFVEGAMAVACLAYLVSIIKGRDYLELSAVDGCQGKFIIHFVLESSFLFTRMQQIFFEGGD